MSNEAALQLIKEFAATIKHQAESHAELGDDGMPFCTMFLNVWAQAANPILASGHKGELADLINDIDASLRRNQMGLIGPGIFHATPENPLWQRVLSYAEPQPVAEIKEAQKPAIREIYQPAHLSL
jgi:hypothetical protein